MTRSGAEGRDGQNQEARSESSLVSRNILVSGRRTSLRLEPVMWDALGEVCRRESKNANELCTMINARRNESSLTAAVRVFILAYFMAAATEEGHVSAGHGTLSEGADSDSDPT
ncbi:ribbon-helix-helix domain-containing protein [Denitrobaculum tricleocarpae]|uniref:Ribbon-helix-helix domain-containing protein n=1 Tax=Denitrobaculum tricleocarpae TaxID=2591009 RepID=A0A545T830_9PROT|nr:ribbon-helix-helix domain-containing protein [Denitrobaculum tricleocarpae]